MTKTIELKKRNEMEQEIKDHFLKKDEEMMLLFYCSKIMIIPITDEAEKRLDSKEIVYLKSLRMTIKDLFGDKILEDYVFVSDKMEKVKYMNYKKQDEDRREQELKAKENEENEENEEFEGDISFTKEDAVLLDSDYSQDKELNDLSDEINDNEYYSINNDDEEDDDQIEDIDLSDIDDDNFEIDEDDIDYEEVSLTDSDLLEENVDSEAIDESELNSKFSYNNERKEKEESLFERQKKREKEDQVEREKEEKRKETINEKIKNINKQKEQEKKKEKGRKATKHIFEKSGFFKFDSKTKNEFAPAAFFFTVDDKFIASLNKLEIDTRLSDLIKSTFSDGVSYVFESKNGLIIKTFRIENKKKIEINIPNLIKDVVVRCCNKNDDRLYRTGKNLFNLTMRKLMMLGSKEQNIKPIFESKNWENFLSSSKAFEEREELEKVLRSFVETYNDYRLSTHLAYEKVLFLSKDIDIVSKSLSGAFNLTGVDEKILAESINSEGLFVYTFKRKMEIAILNSINLYYVKSVSLTQEKLFPPKQKK